MRRHPLAATVSSGAGGSQIEPPLENGLTTTTVDASNGDAGSQRRGARGGRQCGRRRATVAPSKTGERVKASVRSSKRPRGGSQQRRWPAEVAAAKVSSFSNRGEAATAAVARNGGGSQRWRR